MGNICRSAIHSLSSSCSRSELKLKTNPISGVDVRDAEESESCLVLRAT
jgi:hypothetical protein